MTARHFAATSFRSSSSTPFVSIGLTALALAFADRAELAAQDTQAPPVRTSREAMWPAPSADDWKKPVLIQWQRTYEDAVAVAKETGKPILVCTNMDGEIASEHYAGIRYRDPEITKLYEPYVCVIASVYRHTPRDHDDQGRRIPCPRFGTVTCGEHIAIEPGLYEKFMDGRRIAPRHIMVELDGKETFDVFYAFDTASVFRAIGDGISKREIQPKPIVKGDRSLLEKVASRDSADRSAVESAWVGGKPVQRRALLQAAVEGGGDAPLEVLRLALFGLDADLAKTARRALAGTTDPAAVDLLAQALRVPMPADERDALVAALARLGDANPRAETLAVVHQGASRRSRTVDVDGWAKVLDGAGAGSYAAAAATIGDAAAIDARVATAEESAKANPGDAAAQLDQAEALLAQAVDPSTLASLARTGKAARQFEAVMLEDARRAAQKAESLGATGWRVHSVVALASYYLGERQQAHQHAEKAVAELPADVTTWNAFATLSVFAEGRQSAITRAMRTRSKWPPEWLTDVHAAYSVLARHPLGTEAQAVTHYDFVHALGAAELAHQVLDRWLQRFPNSFTLHDRLRTRLLAEQGVAGLEAWYDRKRAEPDAKGNVDWYAGYAAIVAAEFHRRAGDADAAVAAYRRAIERYDASIAKVEDTKATSDHYAAMALGGIARIEFERGAHEAALDAVLASFSRRADAAASLDGLNLSTVDTAKMLLARLRGAKRDDLVAKLQSALSALDPKLLELPAYERETPPPGQGPGQRGEGQPRRGR